MAFIFFFPVPPDIINEETSADVSAQELDNVTLICRASGHPPPKITWRREDHEPVLLKKVGSRDFYKGKSVDQNKVFCLKLMAT